MLSNESSHSYDTADGAAESFIPTQVVFGCAVIGLLLFCACLCQMRNKSYDSLRSDDIALMALRGPSTTEIRRGGQQSAPREQASSESVAGLMIPSDNSPGSSV